MFGILRFNSMLLYILWIFIFLIPPAYVNAHSNQLHNTALSDYVNKNDGVFSWSPIANIPVPGATANLLLLQSQQWRTDQEVNKTVWEHGLIVVIPDQIKSNKSFLLVWSGDNDAVLELDQQLLAIVSQLAISTGSVVSAIRQVPNQPLVFSGDPDNPRDEDALVAYTFDQAMRTGDTLWPAYLPMVKSVVKAMDAIEQFVQTNSQSNLELEGFVLSGFSKRGAAAWLTAAIDSRVIAVAPGVFDALNFAQSMENHRRTYGEFSSAVKDYAELGILDRLRTVESQSLLKIIDPFAYRNALTMPKYIINATGDQFFTPDSSSFYFDQLPGENTLRYLPNTDHGGTNSGFENGLIGLLGWYQRIISEQSAPVITWSRTPNNTFFVKSSIKPSAAVLWRASVPTGRDFRYESVGAIWQPTPLASNATNEYTINLEFPETGANAYYVEFAFQDSLSQRNEFYSTQVIITPDDRPYSLSQSLNNPESANFWHREFHSALKPMKNYYPTYNRQTLQQFLPIKVFDTVVIDVEAGAHILSDYSSPKALGLRECFATRMNIESKKIAWYSNPDLWSTIPYVWQGWNKAHKSFQYGAPWKAAGTCWWINH